MSVSTYDTEKVSTEDYNDTMSAIDILDSRRFFSEGSNGKFELRTFITRVKYDSQQDLFNIGFGVWDDAKQKVDDRIQTRNVDMRMILGTIATIALDFLRKYPFAYLYKAAAKGKSRPVIPDVQQEDVIVQKTYRMAETLKKYPLPGK